MYTGFLVIVIALPVVTFLVTKHGIFAVPFTSKEILTANQNKVYYDVVDVIIVIFDMIVLKKIHLPFLY